MTSLDSPSIRELFHKEHVTVVITDSGLGGISILAGIAARLKIEPIFPGVSLVYFNARPEQERGYNNLESISERVRAFDRALAGMMRYRPDLIMIACNTLSVLYGKTRFSARQEVPVLDIIRFGVEMLHESLSASPEAVSVLMGTVTTIAEDTHRSLLMEMGVSPERLIPLACNQLATRIEGGPDSVQVEEMLDVFMSQAAEKIPSCYNRVFAALLCTHFGYSSGLIRKKLERYTGKPVSVLDPNMRMVDRLFDVSEGIGHGQTESDIKVVSRTAWDRAGIDGIAGLIRSGSPETAEALRRYEHKPDLFQYPGPGAPDAG